MFWAWILGALFSCIVINCRSRKALSTFLHCVAKVPAVLLLWQQHMLDVASKVQMSDVRRHAAEEIVAIKRQRENREVTFSSPQTILSRDLTLAAETMPRSIQRYFAESFERTELSYSVFLLKSNLFYGLWQCFWWWRLSFLTCLMH